VTRSHGGAAYESADGKHLYFYSEATGALFRMPVDGGEETQVAPAVASWDQISVTQKGVYFFSDATTLQLLDEKSGLIRTVFRLQGHSPSNGITVSPDASTLVFSDQSNVRSDLLLVEPFR
jgi:hypothetical protein